MVSIYVFQEQSIAVMMSSGLLRQIQMPYVFNLNFYNEDQCESRAEDKASPQLNTVVHVALRSACQSN